MERRELFSRLSELHGRARRRGEVCCTGFLTPAEQAWARSDCQAAGLDGLWLWGGNAQSERKMAWFFPDWQDPETYEYEELAGVCLTLRFGELSHRDVLGSLLALGVARRAVGDICVQEGRAWFIALAPVARMAADSLTRVGRYAVQCGLVPYREVPAPVVQTRPVRFTVQSLRLDAVVSGLFSCSRQEARSALESGRVSLNYLECQRPDAHVAEGDVISLRGEGKGRVKAQLGQTRKGRIAVEGERWV